MDFIIGTIRILAGPQVPHGFLPCDGQQLPISQHQALFQVIGNTYGGQKGLTFALPNLNNRFPIGCFGSGDLGQQKGVNGHVFNTEEIPGHLHELNLAEVSVPIKLTARLKAFSEVGDTAFPMGARLANSQGIDREYRLAGTPVAMQDRALNLQASYAVQWVPQPYSKPAGGNTAVNIKSPFVALNFVIAYQGVQPQLTA